MASCYYITLKRRNSQLKKHFLTKSVYTYPSSKNSQDNLRAYRVLIHAEIEYYVETLVREKVKKSLDAWKQRHKTNKTLLSLMSYGKRDGTLKNKLDTRIHSVICDFYGIIKQNHGIKESNMVQLLIPIGVDQDQISQTLLSNLDSFGTLRGEQAHTTFKTQQLINPDDEVARVNNIIIDLKELEELVQNVN